jgi:predicted MPP superfamily phosphohydrolase
VFSNPHLWPLLACAAAGFVIAAGVWCLLLRNWARATLRWLWAALAVVLTAAYLVNLDAWLIEPESLVVRRVDVASPGWHGAPLTIAAIGDTHVGGPHMDVARMGRIVQHINALRPELVVLLGDYISGHTSIDLRTENERKEAIDGIAAFAALDARYGAIAAIGNHDVWFDRAAVTRALRDAGLAVLWNRNKVIHRSDGEVVIAGIADAMTGQPDFEAALDGAPEDADTIVISHSPDPFVQFPAGPALMIAAHTHCGQVTIPFVGRPMLPIHHEEFACGRVDRGAQTLYVTAGLGTSILPVRFGNPPEITLITIHGAGQSMRSSW